MDILSRILAVCCLVCLSQAYDLQPFSKESCPSDDYRTNTCWEMIRKNMSCIEINITSGCDQGLSDKQKSPYGAIDALFQRLGLRPHWLWPDVCYDVVRKNCTVSTCNRKCCSGWTVDEYGGCMERLDDKIQCENGGTRFSNTCFCPNDFSGKHCEQALCSDTCLNGGTCTPTTSGNKCNCPEPFYGSTCGVFKANCPWECLNGGTCIVSDTKSVCLCTEGFYGKDCSYYDNKKFGAERVKCVSMKIAEYPRDLPAAVFAPYCPMPNDTICFEPHCHDKCKGDSDCGRNLVCCNDGCCNTCMMPVADVKCRFEGSVYLPGQTFQKDKCTVCKCSNNGEVNCAERVCPSRLPCGEDHVIHPDESCCPVCDNHDDLPVGYHDPRISCPRYGILEVMSFSDTAYVNGLGVKAHDYRNKALPVIYHPITLKHCKCPLANRDNQLVIASTMDIYGRTAECHFNVLVIDKAPPKFISCPADIYAMDDEEISWDAPRTSDNVGIRSVYLEPQGWGISRKFPIGNHTLTYRATDFDGNMEFCQFTIFIFDKDTPPSQMPPGLARRHNGYTKGVQIIAGCLTFVFIIIAIVLLFCFIRRWRVHRARQNQNRQTSSTVPTVSNGAYDSFMDYFGNGGVKLPPYSPPSAPPVYEELAVNAGPSETDLPPQYEVLSNQSPSFHSNAYDNAVYDDSEETESQVTSSQGQTQTDSGDPVYDNAESAPERDRRETIV